MIVIFDLDYTLFDTKRFKNDLATIFNITVEKFCDDYDYLFKKEGVNYSLEKHIEILKNEGKITNKNKEEIRKKFENLLERIDDYLFPEAEEVLKEFKDKGDKLILITFGDKGWQEIKTKNLKKIINYFDEIEFIEEDKRKSQYLKSLKDSGQEILLVNDNPRETLGLKEILGDKCKFFLVEGPYSNNIEHKEEIHKNIKELLIEEPREKELKRQFNIK